MIKQYPHFLYVRNIIEHVQDGSGNWQQIEEEIDPDAEPIEPLPEWSLHSVCREETNGEGTTINGPDGKAVVFSSTIYLPKSTPRIVEGTDIIISETESETGICRIKGQVLKFDVGQLSCRLWL